jgi:hypothetical protein
MTTIRVFVDARPLDVPRGAVALDAVRALDPMLAVAVEANTRLITDSRGLPIEPDTPLSAGFIMRLIARRTRDERDVASETA